MSCDQRYDMTNIYVNLNCYFSGPSTSPLNLDIVEVTSSSAQMKWEVTTPLSNRFYEQYDQRMRQASFVAQCDYFYEV